MESRQFVSFVVFVLAWYSVATFHAEKPNIIFVLTDDQDVVLGGVEPMEATKKVIAKHGATFTNAFVSTPVCCPSRASILTGKYPHNTHVINNTISGNCSSESWKKGVEHQTIATFLKRHGYKTFFGGKYLNQYGKPESGGVSHVPPGWDRWIGLVGNSRYYNYTLSVDGKSEVHGEDYWKDYLADLLKREALSFLTSQLNQSDPFFAMIATPACHSPVTPAPQHAHKFSNLTAPRVPNFNIPPGLDKHWLLRQEPRGPMSAKLIRTIDEVFRNRWRTLLSVDELVHELYSFLKANQLLESTYIIYTSDHGYHMGQFTLPVDKRQPYETDIRVPLLIRGPGIGESSVVDLPVVSIDLAPTILDMAGVDVPDDMDGVSLLPLVSTTSLDWRQTRLNLVEHGDQQWRSSFLVEYHGEADVADIDATCPKDPDTTLCLAEYACKCQDSRNNTYSCTRVLTSWENTLFCQFNDHENFVEYYDLNKDPYQLHNKAFQRPVVRGLKKIQKKMQKLRSCKGIQCFL